MLLQSLPRTDFLYQYSNDALLKGCVWRRFDFWAKETRRFGIQTFNQLDGELIMLNGIIIQNQTRR